MINLVNLLSFGIVIAGAIWGYYLSFQRSLIRLTAFLLVVFCGFFFSRIFASIFVRLDLSLFGMDNLPSFLLSALSASFPVLSKSHFLQLFLTKAAAALLRIVFFLIWTIFSLFFSGVFPVKKKKETNFQNRCFGSLLGAAQTLCFILIFASPVKGVCQVLSGFEEVNHNFVREFPKTIPAKITSISLFENLFSISYQGERINLCRDLEWFQKNRHLLSLDWRNWDYEILSRELKVLNTIELLGATAVEILLLEKSTAASLNEELHQKISEINYRVEITNLYAAYQDYCALEWNLEEDYFNLAPDLVMKLTNSLGKVRTLNIIMPYFLADIGELLSLNEYGIILENYRTAEVVWTEELKNLGRVYQALHDLGITASDFKNLDYEKITATGIENLVGIITSSRLFSLNQEEIVQGVIGVLPEKYHQITFGRFTEEELVDILLFVRMLAVNGFFGKSFSSIKFLTEDNTEATVRLLLGSELMRKNLREILILLFEEKNLPLEVFEFPEDVDWAGSEGVTELTSLFYLARVFSTREKYRDLVLENLQTLLASGLYTKTIYRNISKIIDYFEKSYFEGTEIIKEDGIDWEKGKLEFYALMEIYYHLLKSNLFYNMKNPGKVFAELEDDEIYELAAALQNSDLLRININTIIAYLLGKSGFLFPVAEISDEDWTDAELYHLLAAFRIIGGIEDPFALFNVSDTEMETVLKSNLLSRSLVNYICELPQTIDFLKVDLTNSDEKWYPKAEDEGELRRLLRGLKLLAAKGDFTTFDINIICEITTGYRDEATDELSVILASQVLYDSLLYNIKKLRRNPNTGEGFLIIDIYDEDWLDSPPPYRRPGEIRNLVRGLQLLFPEGIDLANFTIDQERINNLSDGTVDTNGDNIIDDADDNDLREILRSKIISDTIIFLALNYLR
jgi:hypothetical protein